MPSIKCDDTVRKPADMKPADLEGLEGRWLDVPRLQQKSAEVRSSFWCGRASAAMVYNYLSKAQGKADQYIGHDDGEAGPGLNAAKFNLRFLGGSNKGKLAGVDEDGKVNPAGIFAAAGWKTDSGELAQDPNVNTDGPSVEKRFARHLEQLKKNNPVVQYTLLSKDRGHIVVIAGYKKDSDRGELWLRVVDPDYPQEDLLGAGNFRMITRPETPGKEFSEYWLKAARLLQPHPGKPGKRLFAHADAEGGHFFYALPDPPVKDDHELVHKVGKGLGETAGKKDGAAPKQNATSKDDAKPAGPEASCPPLTGVPRLPFFINGSNLVTGAALTSLYHQTERGLGGFFPLGDSGMFHSGAHLTPAPNAPIMAMADGEVVAARLGMGPGEHAWGDTGFVLLRHKVKGDKNVYSLYLHFKREPLHPDTTDAGWLKRLLIDAMQEKGAAAKKPKWRVMEAQPTWKDADRGKFSPTNVATDDKLEAGVYQEDEELVADHKRYVKLKGKWVRALGPDGSGLKVKELSPWSDFDLEKACKNSPSVKDLRDGKVAVLDALKSDDGKGHQYTVEAGETVGRSGWYLGSPALHWSVFSKDAVFPTGALGEAEFTADEAPKVADLDLSSKEHGTKEHATALIEAVDPKKKWIGKKDLEWIIEPGELRHFYRTPAQCWRGRYQAVKGLVDFKLDLDKLTRQDRYKSHTETERGDFVKSGKAFLFWDELAKADDFPTDGKAVFVHPVTALRMMSQVRVEHDHDDPKETDGANAEDRTHAGEDVVIVVRDAKGPLAAVEVTVKADGAVILTGKTDSQGEIIVKIEDVVGKDIEVSVDASVVGDKGQLVQVANETASPATLTPGDAPGNQTFNGDEVVPNPRLALKMKVKKGAMVKQFARWDEGKFEVAGPGAFLEPEASVTAERIVFRSDDGKKECISLLQGSVEVFCWSIENGEEKIALDLPAEQKKKDPDVIASWSARIAHLKDHPVLAGRVQNLEDGTEIEVSWQAMMAVGAPEHDHDLGKARCKVALGGFAIAFDPHVLTSDNNLLNAPRPVYAKLKVKGKDLILRDQAVTIYGDSKFPDPPAKPQTAPPLPGTKVKEIVGWLEVDRGSDIDRPNGWGGKEHERFATRAFTQLTGAAAHRITADGVDKIWVAPCLPSQHLALDSEAALSPADAAAHHGKAIKTSFPDAPDWVIASDLASAWKADNGIQTGLCAVDCKSSVAPPGRKSGCSEQVRQANLGSCHNGTAEKCQTAVQIGKSNTVKKDGCPQVITSCGAAQHDKSHCFLTGIVKGDNAEERERWHVRLPMRTSGAGYPYLRDTGKNARVLLVNPASGAAVVCSQEARGPQGEKCGGNLAVPEAAVEKDEFKDKDTLLAASYETFWKLGLPRGGGGEAVVLMAFCDVNTRLGPVPADLPIKLKKTISFDSLMGDAAPVEPGVPGEKVKSSNIVVGGKHFVDWYNQDFAPLHKGRHPTLIYGKDGMHPVEFPPGNINKMNFKKVFDHCEPLWAREISLGEFVAILCIMLNEVGGNLAAVGEHNGPKYMFEAGPRKQSYNGILGNKKAGDQLLVMGAITEDQVGPWNKHDGAVYPDDAGIEDKVRECDFFKFRGHGLNQLTGRGNYDAHMNKFLKQYCGKGMDEMTGAEMEDAIQNKPEVYLASFKSFFAKGGMKEAMGKTNEGEFWKVGKINSGGDQYADLFEYRCKTMIDAMTQATYEFR